MRVLVDTNVFLDYLTKRLPFYEESRDFFSYFIEHNHEIVVSPMTFRDVEYVLRKVEHDRLARRNVLHSIYSIVYKIIDLTPDDVINALFEDYSDFEDGLLMESAERKLLDGIVTNNASDFKQSKVHVYSPSKLVELLKRNDG